MSAVGSVTSVFESFENKDDRCKFELFCLIIDFPSYSLPKNYVASLARVLTASLVARTGSSIADSSNIVLRSNLVITIFSSDLMFALTFFRKSYRLSAFSKIEVNAFSEVLDVISTSLPR